MHLIKYSEEASIKLLHVSAPWCRHQGVILNKGVQGQHVNLGIVLSDRGICDELINRPEESYRVWCV
jgi:hypothetical protein